MTDIHDFYKIMDISPLSCALFCEINSSRELLGFKEPSENSHAHLPFGKCVEMAI